MERLQISCFDLFLIHQAVDPKIAAEGGKMDVETTCTLYHVLEELYHEYIFRAIGVSNFNTEQLQILMESCSVPPMVDEIRSNPAQRNLDTVNYCKEHGILPLAHSPMNFTAGAFQVDQAVAATFRAKAGEIGAAHGQSWAQVLLRWNYEMGICSIPKSSNPKNQSANLEIFDFQLTKEEFDALI